MKIKSHIPILFIWIVVLCVNTILFAGRGWYQTRAMSLDEFAKLQNHMGVFEEGKQYNKIINGYGTGLIPPSEAQWNKILNQNILMLGMPLAAPPPSVDHSTKNSFPPVGNQGQYGSCVPWATGYYIKTFQEAEEHGWDLSSAGFTENWFWEIFPDTSIFTPEIELTGDADKIFSPTFIYHMINGGWNQGSTFEDAVNLLRQIGCCTWENMPVDSTPYTVTDSTLWASEDGWREAPLYRSKTGYAIIDIASDTGLVTLKQVIADGHLACFGMDASYFDKLSLEDLFSLNNYTADSSNHAGTIVGYDDTYGPYTELGEPGTFGAFKVVNSWGVGFPDENVADGFYYISYACMKQRIKYAYFYENEINYNPQLITVFNMYHDTTRGDCLIKFGLGDTFMPTAIKPFNNYQFIDQTSPMSFPSNDMAFDITDFMPNLSGGANEYYLQVYDRTQNEGGYSDPLGEYIGRIDTFYIEFYDNYQSGIPTDTYLSTDPYPVATEDGDSVYAWVIDRDSITVIPMDTTVTWQEDTLELVIDAISSQPLDWTASIIQGGSWLSFVGSSTGIGDASLAVHFDENFDTVNPRVGIVELVCPLAVNNTVQVTITQSRAEYLIEAVPDTFSLSWLDGDDTSLVNIVGPGTINWSASVISGASWLSITSGSSGTGDDTLFVHHDMNTDPVNDRTGTIRISSSDPGVINSPVDVVFNQTKAEYILYVLPDTISTTFMAGDSLFDLSFTTPGALDWTASVIEGDGWLHITSGSSGIGGGTIFIHYDENFDTLNARTGEIQVISLLAVNDTVNVTVVQARYWDALRVLPDTIPVTYWSGNNVFEVYTYADIPLDWNASVPVGGSWLDITSGSSGSGRGSVQVHYDANPDPVNSRVGTVRLISAGAINSPYDVFVSQPKGEYTFDVVPDTFTVAWDPGDTTVQMDLTGPADLVWTATVIQGGSWLSVTSGATGKGDGSIDLHYEVNTDPVNDRVGIVRVVNDSAMNSPYDIRILQVKGEYTISADPDTLNLFWTEEDTTVQLDLTGPLDLVWTASIIQGHEWLQFASDSVGQGDGDFSIHCDPNVDPVNDRTGRIRVSSDSAMNSPVDIIVNQVKGVYTLSLIPPNITASWQAGDTMIQVLQTGPVALSWNATIEEGALWLSIVSGNSGSGDDTISVHYGENVDFDNTRVGKIQVVFNAPNNDTLYAFVTQIKAVEFYKIDGGDIASDQNLSQGSSWADYDADGDLDLLVTNGNDVNQKSNTLYINNNDETFTKSELGMGSSYGSSWGDYNNDGYQDLFIANYGRNFLYRGGAGGVLTLLEEGDIVLDQGYSRGCSWGDYDIDGFLDLFVANYNDQQNNLYHNNGDGTFTKILTGSIVTDKSDSKGCGWSDYDNDGYPDLFVTNYDNQNNTLYHNNGDGTFTKVIMGDIVNNGGKSQGCSWGDYNNDGYIDLFVANRNNQNNFLYQNHGDGTFTRIMAGSIVQEGGSSYGSTWADFDNDGDIDIIIANSSNQPNFHYRNNGDGTFLKVTDGETVEDQDYSYGASCGDIDHDGDLDLFITNYNEPSILYKNNVQYNHWLTIRCIGKVTNRSAIGAMVRVKASVWENDVWQVREISGQTGYLCQNALYASFGLGDATVIDSLEIRWPSGIKWDTTNVALDQFITITEQANLPVALDDEVSTMQETPVTVSVLANDSDADGDPLTIQSIIHNGVHGTIAVNPGDTTLTYTPAAEFADVDTFRYVITDGKAGRDTAQVLILVVPRPNSPPVAIDDETTTMEGVPVSIFIVDNDTDSDGDDLIIQSLDTLNTIGAVDINPGDTSVVYIPAYMYAGTDMFSYIISDGREGTDTARVYVTVTKRPNHAPVALGDTVTTGSYESITIDVLANDTDEDGDSLTVIALNTTATNGTAEIDEGDTSVTYHPNEGFTGFDTFYYQVSDGREAIDSAMVVVEVTKYSKIEGRPLPTFYYLSQNYPNPFNPETEIQYQLPEKTKVIITVFSILGRRVTEIIDETHKPGYYKIRWQGTDNRGLNVPSGIYLLRIQAGSYHAIRKMTLLR